MQRASVVMCFLTGLLFAALSGFLSWQLASLAVINLPASRGHEAALALVAVGVVAGFLPGSALCRRAARSTEHLGLFGALAFAAAGGMLGALFGVVLSVAYVATYAAWPSDLLEQILLILSYPVLAALGLSLGALLATPVGLVTAGALRILHGAR